MLKKRIDLIQILSRIAFVSFFFYSAVQAEQPKGFTQHGRFTGICSTLATIIAPGPEKDTERLYASHIYSGIVATDPLTWDTDVFQVL